MQTDKRLFVSLENDPIKLRTDLLSVVSVSYRAETGRRGTRSMEELYIPVSADFPLQAFSAECLWENLGLLSGPESGPAGGMCTSSPLLHTTSVAQHNGKQIKKRMIRRTKERRSIHLHHLPEAVLQSRQRMREKSKMEKEREGREN